jgi:surface antigen
MVRLAAIATGEAKMAFKTIRMIKRSALTMLAGASLALTSAVASPALATTEHGVHHSWHSSHAAYHRSSYHHTLHHSGIHSPYRNSSATLHGHGVSSPYRHVHHAHYYYRHSAYRHSGLQCVPYAREISHISLSGDAFLWWAEASGRYARGNVPEEGAVLNFRSIGRMPLGHVAVVTAVEDSRTILVTQANWVRGTITNDVTVQDVSPNNDWTQVKVELGETSTGGASYPTYGFIYNRPDVGTTIAASARGTEVAEAPAVTQVSDDAPNRNLQ